jgi:hypothetical protein
VIVISAEATLPFISRAKQTTLVLGANENDGVKVKVAFWLVKQTSFVKTRRPLETM